MPGPSQCYAREKVFCSECFYLENVSGNTVYPIIYECTHPDNRSEKYDTWYKRSVSRAKRPQKINKKNNCPWFSKRGGGKKLL
jgi:hypothetical protein